MTQFRQSRIKLALMAALFAAWTGVVGFMAYISAHADGLWPYLALSLFAPLALAGTVAAVAAAMSCWQPATLTADDTGVVFKTWRSERAIAWDRVAAFSVLSPGSRLRSPGCELKEGPRKFVSFGRNWEQTPEEIVEGLNAAGPASLLPE